MDESRPFPWLRSPLFPLIVVVLLVYLASQTLLSPEDERERIAYSDLKELVRESPEQVDLVVFEPQTNGIEVDLREGRKYESNYPGDASQLELERELDEAGVRHDARSAGATAWWSFATYLLPFVLFFGFWILLMKRAQRGTGGGDDAPT